MLNDDYNYCMASMNYGGLVLASEAKESDLDNYEEDDDDMDDGASNAEKKSKKNSHIYFKPFNEWR